MENSVGHTFCLQLEASCLQVSFIAYSCALEHSFAIRVLLLTILCLQLEIFCLQWESASDKHLNGL